MISSKIDKVKNKHPKVEELIFDCNVSFAFNENTEAKLVLQAYFRFL